MRNSQAVLYSQSPCSLKSIAQATCPAGFNPSEYEQSLLNNNQHLTNSSRLSHPFKPTFLTTDPNTKPRVTNQHRLAACNRDEQKVLANLSHYAGGSAVMGLANMMWDTKIPDAIGELNTFGGNGMGAAVAKSSHLLSAINDYDQAVQRLQDLQNHRAAPRTIRAAAKRAEYAFRTMKQRFSQASLRYLNNAEYKMRATKTVTGKPVWESIPVRDNGDIQKLAKFAKVGRIAGPGVIALDGYLRANKVAHMRKDNNPLWKREAFVQGGAFAVGIVAGVTLGAMLIPTALGLGVTIVFAGSLAVAIDYAARSILEFIWDNK